MGIIDVKIEKPALMREERAEETDEETDTTEGTTEGTETTSSRRGRILTGLAAIGTGIIGIITLRRLRERRRAS